MDTTEVQLTTDGVENFSYAREAKAWYGKFNLDFLVRAGIVYNTGKYYVGTSFVGKNYNYHRNNFSVDNGFGTLQIYAGFNFNTRKEYRKKK